MLAKLNLHLLTYHFRKFIVAVKEFLHSEKEFVSFFMKASREHYGHLLFRDNSCDLRKHCDASVSHTVEGFVQEVRVVFFYPFVYALNTQIMYVTLLYFYRELTS